MAAGLALDCQLCDSFILVGIIDLNIRMPKPSPVKYIPVVDENYNFADLKKLSTRYLAGKNLDPDAKQSLRDAFRALYEYDPQEELNLTVERLKELRKIAIENSEFAAACSCDKTLSIIFREKLKAENTAAAFSTDSNTDSSRHLKNLFPQLSNPEEIAKAAAFEIAKIRATAK